MIRILILVFLIGCGSTGKIRPVETVTPTEALKAKVQTYMELNKNRRDEFGWLMPMDCDGLLFNSLAKIAGFPGIDIFAAEEQPGQWRRNGYFDICCPGTGSGSCISRDGFRGLIPLLVILKDVAALRRIHDYGQSHGWIMGKGEVSRTYFNLGIRNQLKRALKIDPDTGEEILTVGDFELHLEVLRIWTEYLISGFLYEFEVDALKQYSKDYPENALYSALYHKFTDGDMSQAISVLMNEKYFPSDRLPTDKDRFTHYLFQRDPGPDWEPCNDSGEQRRCEGLVHNGIDLMFVAWIILN